MKNCNNIQEKLSDYIDQNLQKNEVELVENHLKNCENCTKELAELQQLFTVFSSDVDELPSENLHLNFNKILLEESEKLTTATKVVSLNTVEKSSSKHDWKQYLRIVASIAIVISAFLIGKYQPNKQTQLANQPTKQEKQVLAMLTNDSASKRIQGIDLSEEITHPDNAIINALISRLFTDENTNVRLASAEALAKFTSLTIVKDALLKALETDKEPTVQIELIQILAKIQEKRALEPMQKLLKKEDTPKFIKQELQHNIASLL